MSAQMMTLPPISLADLPEDTKDYLIALSNQDDTTIAEAMRKVLDLAAANAGFSPTGGAGSDAALAA